MLQVVASPIQKIQKACWKYDCHVTYTTMTEKSFFDSKGSLKWFTKASTGIVITSKENKQTQN